MKRDVASLGDGSFDLLVIGGGIVGACTAWDAALRGLRVALVERGDFGSETSANSLKIIHGGLRYLQHLHLRRMRRSIRERSTWLRIAPHLVEPLPVLVPTYREGLQRKPLMRAALAINDVASWRRNDGVAAERRLPAARALTRDESLSLVPGLNTHRLTGGVLFHDAQMYSADRIILEVIQAAHAAGAVVANYVRADARSIADLKGPERTISVRDVVTDRAFQVRARTIVNATGPEAPAVARQLIGSGMPSLPGHSIAMNIVVPARDHAVAYTSAAATKDPNAVVSVGRRQLLFVPWRDRTLVGTAHFPCDGDGGPNGTEREELLLRFLDEVNGAIAGPPVGREEVLLVHAGLLPAATADGSRNVRMLKEDLILDHAADGARGIFSIISVKYTTARAVAEVVVNGVFASLGFQSPPSSTATTMLPGASASVSPEQLLGAARSRYGDLLEESVLEHLVRTYGTRYERVLSYREHLSDWSERIISDAPVIRAQFALAIEEEMAQSLEDQFHRRTELGPRGFELSQYTS